MGKAEKLFYQLVIQKHSTPYMDGLSITKIEAALLEARNEVLEEAANLIEEPCPYFPSPCGDCRHCFLTKAAIRIRSLKSEGAGK